MKQTNLFAILFLMVVGLQTARAQKMIVRTTDNTVTEFDVTNVADVTFVEASPTPDPGNHAWVDLGLPSGTKWATCNVGASSPEEYGDYFAWGETKPKGTYDWSTYFDTDDSGNTFKKYNNDGGLTELLPEDDAATANWGGSWRMPTLEQMEELLNNCSRQWTTLNGVNGTLVTGPNGNTIFLPAAGNRWDDVLDYGAGSGGDYRSRSLYPDYGYCAYALYFASGGWGWLSSYRSDGLSVRPVRP